jgi:hypothetical protein
MVHALLVLAADESEPSKVPFYVCGIALVVWAIVLAAVGLTRPEFPGAATRERGVIGLTALLVVAAMATAVITA